MKNVILASVAAVGLLGMAACSDSGTDKTTTQSTNPPATESQPSTTPMTPDTSASPNATPALQSGTGGDMPANEPSDGAMKPVSPAPAQ